MTMKKSRHKRIGKDLKIRWPILTNGNAVPLDGRDLKLILRTPTSNELPMAFVSSENVAEFTFRGVEQTRVGRYSLTMWENYGKDGQTVVDYCDAFTLVARSCEESDEVLSGASLDVETVELEAGTLEIGVPGMSAYELYIRHNPDSQLTEEEYAESPVQAAGAALAAIEQLEETEASVKQDEQLREQAEQTRVTNESARQTAEAGRQAAEAKREENTSEAIRNCETAANTAVAAANIAAGKANEAATTANNAAESAQHVVDTYDDVINTLAHSDCTLDERVEALERALISVLSGAVVIPKLQVNKLGVWGDNNLAPVGDGAPTKAPGRAGQFYIDKTARALYFSTGNTAVSDWKIQ